MSLAIAINLRTYVLAAGEVLHLSAVGNFVRCLEATATFKLAIDDGEQTDFFKGLGYRSPDGAEFSRLTIVNTSGASNTIQLATALGEVDDSRFVLSGAGTIPVEQTIDRSPRLNSNDEGSLPATTQWLLALENSNYAEFMVHNRSGLAIPLRVGDAGTSAVRGIPVPDGAMVSIRSRGPLYIYNPNAAAATFGMSWTTWT